MEQLELAYAITVHKAQGSQFNNVILVLNKNSRMLSRELLYTAITRAKRMVIVVGNLQMLNRMIDNISELKRFTKFSDRIKEFA